MPSSDPPQDHRVLPPGTTLEGNKSWLETNKAEATERLKEEKRLQRAADAERYAPPDKASISEAFKSIKPSDYSTFLEKPCVRDGLLTGIGAGTAMGALRIVLRSSIPRAANWAVGSFVLANIIQYEYCQYRRREEKSKMKRVVEVYDQKQAEMRNRKLEEDRRRREKEIVAVQGKTNGGWSSWLRFW